MTEDEYPPIRCCDAKKHWYVGTDEITCPWCEIKEVRDKIIDEILAAVKFGKPGLLIKKDIEAMKGKT